MARSPARVHFLTSLVASYTGTATYLVWPMRGAVAISRKASWREFCPTPYLFPFWRKYMTARTPCWVKWWLQEQKPHNKHGGTKTKVGSPMLTESPSSWVFTSRLICRKNMPLCSVMCPDLMPSLLSNAIWASVCWFLIHIPWSQDTH